MDILGPFVQDNSFANFEEYKFKKASVHKIIFSEAKSLVIIIETQLKKHMRTTELYKLQTDKPVSFLFHRK